MAVPIDRPLVCPILVGREAALDALRHLIAWTASGHGQVVLVSGEAGIGKSRLVAEARAQAGQQRLLALQGNCFEPDRALPYAPLLDLLRAVSPPTDFGTAVPQSDMGNDQLVKLPAEFAPLLPDLLALPSPEPGQEKRRLFQALARFFSRHATTQPLLVVVEDLHWSDDNTLEFLLHFARRLAEHPILLLLTYRNEDVHLELRHFLAELDRERLAAEIRLGRLELEEVDAMLQAIFDLRRPVQPALLETVYSLTDGNPFFIEEVLKSLVAAGAVLNANGLQDHRPMSEFPIPRTIQDAVQRLAEPRATLQTARIPVWRPGMEQRPRARTERDSLGPLEVPAGAYYGASTRRAELNFPISNLRFSRRFIRALGLIKLAAAEVNRELGLLDPRITNAVIQAAQELADGKFDDQFVVDIFQTGSGTSTNMNANEVIANRATQLLGGEFGSKLVHPNDHVNLGQSSNDVIPAAIHLAALMGIQGDLVPALENLRAALAEKAEEFWPIVKTGRTHLQDATPIRMGQEFLGYAGQIERGLKRLRHAQEELEEVALGGTAVGTGINTHPEFAGRVTARLSELAGVSVRETSNHFQAQSTLDSVAEASGSLRTIAISLLKIANDIRWMASGPRAGLQEIELPAVQPGSSIMPGKINPVIPESVAQVSAQVIGNDATIIIAAQSGNFELNVMMPVAAHNLLQSIDLLASSAANFADQAIKGLRATQQGPEMVEKGLMLATALAPVIGYDAAAELAKEAYKTGRTIRELARERTSLSEEELNRVLDPGGMTEPGLTGAPAGG